MKNITKGLMLLAIILFIASCGANERKINKQIATDSLKIAEINDSLSIINNQISKNEQHKNQIRNNIKVHNDIVKQKCIDFATGVSLVRICSYYAIEKTDKNPNKSNYLQSGKKYIKTLDIEGFEFNENPDIYNKIDINWKIEFYTTEIDNYIKSPKESGGLPDTRKKFISFIQKIDVMNLNPDKISSTIVDKIINLEFYNNLPFLKKNEFESFLNKSITDYIDENYIDKTKKNYINSKFKNEIDKQDKENQALSDKKQILISEKEKLQSRIDKNKLKINKTNSNTIDTNNSVSDNSNENKNNKKTEYGFFIVFIIIASGIAYLIVRKYYKRYIKYEKYFKKFKLNKNTNLDDFIKSLQKRIEEISIENNTYKNEIENLKQKGEEENNKYIARITVLEEEKQKSVNKLKDIERNGNDNSNNSISVLSNEKKDKLIDSIFYLNSQPTPNGEIPNNICFEQYKSFFKAEFIKGSKEQKIKFWVAENSSFYRSAIQRMDTYLLPVCEMVNMYNANALLIETIEPGEAELTIIDNKKVWKCTKKAKIKLL